MDLAGTSTNLASDPDPVRVLSGQKNETVLE